MELSAELFRSVAFRERWRGYDPDEVDDFLERVATGLAILQERLAEANSRIERAEGRVAERADAEDAMRRTLVLAQRTADEAVGEAERRAEAITTEAERRAAQIVGEAEARATEIEAAARRRTAETAAEAQRHLRADIADLEAARLALSTDIDLLRRHMHTERDRMRADLRRNLQILEDPGTLRMDARPELTEVAIPDAPEGLDAGSFDDEESAADAAPAGDAGPTTEPDGSDASATSADPDDRVGDERPVDGKGGEAIVIDLAPESVRSRTPVAAGASASGAAAASPRLPWQH